MSDEELEFKDAPSPAGSNHTFTMARDEPTSQTADEPELGFSPISSSSSGDFDMDMTSHNERSYTDVMDDVDDRLMSEKEIEELDKRMADVVERLQKQRDDHDQWENDLNARRLKAFARIKTLGRTHRKRLELYETVKDYIQKSKEITNGTDAPKTI